MDDVVFHQGRRQFNGTHSLTHSILINIFIKVGLNSFSPTSPAKYCFCPKYLPTYVCEVSWGYLKGLYFCPSTWRNAADFEGGFSFAL